MSEPNGSAWPDDADGNVLSRLRERGLDFSQEYTIDFVVDFDDWPPDARAIEAVRLEFPNVVEYVDRETGRGSLTVKVVAKLSYDLVTLTQARLTELSQGFGGWCDSWGLLH